MFLHLLHVFLVIFALAILIFIVIILTLACSNNFVCIFLYLQGQLGWVFLSCFFSLIWFFDLPFFDLPFLSFLFFWFLVLLFVSSQSSTV